MKERIMGLAAVLAVVGLAVSVMPMGSADAQVGVVLQGAHGEDDHQGTFPDSTNSEISGNTCGASSMGQASGDPIGLVKPARVHADGTAGDPPLRPMVASSYASTGSPADRGSIPDRPVEASGSW